MGQTSSFKIGLENISSESQGIMLLPVDYPVIGIKTIKSLLDFFAGNKPSVLIPSFNDHKGHPPVFHVNIKNEFLNLDNSVGINTIAHQHQKDTTVLPVNDLGVIRSFNTQKEFKRLTSAVVK